MSRNLKAAAAALALAGGVYLVGAAPVEASNMGFKLERSFDLLRRSSGAPLPNIYFVAFPLFNGTADLANTTAINPATNQPYANKCVGETGGPTAPDGIVNSDDAICDMYTARGNSSSGVFTLTYIDRNTCSPIARNATFQLGSTQFTGTPFPLVPDAGYQVRITSSGPTISPTNRAVIVGSHDPSFAGRQIIAMPDCAAGQTDNCCGPTARRLDMVNLPYHTMYRTSFEILCGLEGTDWVDVVNNNTGNPPGDGKPDTCWDDLDGDRRYDVGEPTTGVFDGRRAMQVLTFRNDETTGGTVGHNAVIPLGTVDFTGQPFDLVPGDAYMLQIDKLHTPTTFLSPHF